jgi:hypothetical protein
VKGLASCDGHRAMKIEEIQAKRVTYEIQKAKKELTWIQPDANEAEGVWLQGSKKRYKSQDNGKRSDEQEQMQRTAESEKTKERITKESSKNR